MTGFVSHHPLAQAQDETLENEAFFPPISTNHMRAVARLTGNTTPALLRDALVAAMLHVNNELRPWAQAQAEAGHAQLQDVPAPQIGGASTRVHAYLRAVAHAAQAHLDDASRAQATLPAGLNKDARVHESVGLRTGDHWQAVRHAIADVMSRMRETVTLI